MSKIVARIIEIYPLINHTYKGEYYIRLNQEIIVDGKYTTEDQALIYFPHYFWYNEGYGTKTEVFEYG